MPIDKETIDKIYRQSDNASDFFDELGDIILNEFSYIKIIGQIERPEGEETYEMLRCCLDKILSRYGAIISFLNTVVIPKRLRAVFSLYFVWTGVFHYGKKSGNELWGPVFSGLSLPYDQNASTEYGKLFLQSLEENNLETFAHVRGLKYVTKILLHGLIPEIHLDKFIQELIVPEQGNVKGKYLTGNDLVDKIQNNSNLQYQPQTIQRFVKYGWPVNAQILDRFWDMVKNSERKSLHQWWRWGLPKYMVDAFSKWVNNPNFAEIKKRYKKKEFGGRPFLSFDFEKECPVLIIPSQKIPEQPSFLEIRYSPLNAPKEELFKTKLPSISIDGIYYSDKCNQSVYPSDNWRIQFSNNASMFVHYDFPVGDDEKSVPIYLFNCVTSKLVGNFPENCPQELIIVYPKQSEFILEGGTMLTDCIPLYHKWKAWQYIHCELGEKVVFLYKGKNIYFNQEIEETISFNRRSSKQNRIRLTGKSVAPSWIRSADDSPIITDDKNVRFIFTQWGYMSGELIRLDANDQTRIEFFKLEFQESSHKISASFPNINIRPGAYKINFRGAIGIDDFTLYFVFLPINDYGRIYSPGHHLIADKFRISFSQQIDLEPIENTVIRVSNSKTLAISVKEDNGDAFCALKLFPNTLRPVVLLLARSDIRWVRHSEDGYIDWCFWRSRNEDITVQRMDELKHENLRALIEIDHISESLSKKLQQNNNRLRLIFENTAVHDPLVLMSDEVRNYKRNSRIWFIRLDKFSEQLKSSLKEIESANLRLDNYDGLDKPILFTLLRKPEFKDFEIRSLGTDENSETLRVTWKPHTNEPRRNRILTFYATDNPKQTIRKKINDEKQPPFQLSLTSPAKPEMWTVEIDVQTSLFGFNRFAGKTSETKSEWMRIPARWTDWLEWYDISPEEIPKRIPGFESLNSEIKRQSLRWCDFLHTFYYGNDDDSIRRFMTIVGDNTINNALPFSSGNIWHVKTSSKNCLSLKIHSSSIKNDSFSYLKNWKLFQWNQIPEDVEIQLCMNTYHRYLGKSGTTWNCYKEKGHKKPVMQIGTEKFSMSAWLMAAVSPSEKADLVAQLPFERLWDNPPLLPILDKLPSKDSFFIHTEKKKQDAQSRRQFHNRQFHNDSLKTALTECLYNNQDSVSSEDNERAFTLVRQWLNLSESQDSNPLLKRMIKGRYEYDSVQIITGSAAFISRLKANGYENYVFKNNCEEKHLKKMNKLLDDTIHFVCEFLPRAFLRDLVLSELIIGWYWNQKIYQSSKDTSSAQEFERLKNRQKPKNTKSASLPSSTEKAEHPGKIVSSASVKTWKSRTQPVQLSEQEAKNCWKKYKSFTGNDFIDNNNNNNTVTDHNTGLIWQKYGSSKTMKVTEIKSYLKKLNGGRFAGYSDWRVPTLEELGTLLAHNRKPRNKGLFAYYIDPVFCQKKTLFWSSDIVRGLQNQNRWFVSFYDGSVKKGNNSFKNYVRAVRSVESTA